MESSAPQQADHWDRWAQAYPDLYKDRDPEPAVEFLHRLCGDGRVAELGAGSGRVCVPLAARGVIVTAVEVSPLLCTRLAEQSDGLDLTVLEADMATLEAGPFRLIYAVHSSFFHLTSQDEQIACLANARRILEVGGSVVLSCYVPSAELMGNRRRLELSGIGADSIDIRATEVDSARQVITYREVSLSAAGTQVLPVRQRWAWPAEIDLMARLGGLKLEARYGGFDMRPFDHTCTSHVSVFTAAD